MGRVEKRMYKRRRKRQKRLQGLVLILLFVLAGGLLWRRWPASFSTESIGRPGATEKTAAENEQVETREVTLGEETWYAIQTGVFSSREAATQRAEAYAQRGAPGTVVQEGEKWRVFIACYPSEAEAAAVRTQLEENQRVETYLYGWKCPELRLRLTGKVGQLDAVEAGFTLILSTASTLRDTAAALDAAQLTAQDALDVLTSLDGQISLWEETICSRFGKHLPQLARELMTITGNWEHRYRTLRETEGVTALSAGLKMQGMGMYDEFCAWRRAFAAQ